MVKRLSKVVCIFKDSIYFLFCFCCCLFCTHSYLWCCRNSQDVGRAHASAVGVQVWLLTQRWAGRQLLFSTRCQTSQSVVLALVHPLPFPDKTMWKCQVRTSTCHYVICKISHLMNGANPGGVHLLWSHFPTVGICCLPQQLTELRN